VALRLEPLADAQLVLGGAEQVGLLLGVHAALGGQIWFAPAAFAYIVETEQDFSLGRISIAITSHVVKSYHVGRWSGFNWLAMDRRQITESRMDDSGGDARAGTRAHICSRTDSR
jgi:hypothetical protein